VGVCQRVRLEWGVHCGERVLSLVLSYRVRVGAILVPQVRCLHIILNDNTNIAMSINESNQSIARSTQICRRQPPVAR
jgi:hypothetical protein